MSIENQLVIANIAFESGNYASAYNDFSSILEKDIENSEAWIKKGLSSGHLSTAENSRLKEVLQCLNQANKFNISSEQKLIIGRHILDISEKYITELLKEANNVSELNSLKPMATGELYATKQLKNTVGRLVANNNIFDRVHEAVKFSLNASDFIPDIEIVKAQVNLIDRFFSAINNELHKDKIPVLLAIKADLVSKIKSVDTSYVAKISPKSDGCFIATFVYDDYNSEEVLILRNLRDNFLRKNSIGIQFVNFYYLVSPTMVKVFRRIKGSKTVIKNIILEPLILILRKCGY